MNANEHIVYGDETSDVISSYQNAIEKMNQAVDLAIHSGDLTCETLQDIAPMLTSALEYIEKASSILHDAVLSEK